MSKRELYYYPLLSGFKNHILNPKQRSALVIGMYPWREYINQWIFESCYIQIQRHFDLNYFNYYLKLYLKVVNPVVYIWGYKAPQFFIDYIRQHNLDVFFIEDGFIRSTPCSQKSSSPLSIVMDSQAPYFDTTRPNDLTDLIDNFDFDQVNYDENLVQELLDYFLSHRVSKYNQYSYIDVRDIYGVKDRKRILILGQVSRDSSLQYGGGNGINLIDVITQARKDHPDAQLIVKPHPMTLEDKSTLYALEKYDCLILSTPIHLVDALETIDYVYTITSFGGFEALLRGKKVTVLGNPFYKPLCDRDIKESYYFLICYMQYS